MSTSLPSPDLNSGPLKVSVLARVVPSLSYLLAALGAGVSAMLITGVMRAMRFAEAAGVSAVAGGLAEANVPVLIVLYLGVVCGLAGVILIAARLSVTTTTVTPGAWFLFVGGALGLLPLALLWHVESILMQILTPATTPGGGIAAIASSIQLLLTLIMIAAPITIVILIVGSVWPMYSSARPKWAPLLASMLIEGLLVVATLAFQFRTSWLFSLAAAN